ncbi:hypothetical protein RRG08_041753 [Elysia crispata]|uniref:Uncharacterized protein n=1 Tax=Elysia crispata TaxID=231223 RepID=A0AAE0YYV7_9GAST|nr:hypothetical protein RRG08_041753 [Elysia crispata]
MRQCQFTEKPRRKVKTFLAKSSRVVTYNPILTRSRSVSFEDLLIGFLELLTPRLPSDLLAVVSTVHHDGAHQDSPTGETERVSGTRGCDFGCAPSRVFRAHGSTSPY